jgi:DNA-binding IclR family transcriptional regulator
MADVSARRARLSAGSKTGEKRVNGLVSGLRVIRHLSRTSSPMGVNQIARDLELNPSTCFNLMKTLVSERLAEFDPETKNYNLGFGVVALARDCMERDSLGGLVRPHLEALATRHQVTASLWHRLGENRLVMVHGVDSAGPISVHMKVGRTIPLYIAALGRCMAANSDVPEEILKKYFAAMRWQSPPNFTAYREQVRQAAVQGFAIDPGNFWNGVTAIAAPILNRQGKPIAGISSVGFSEQFSQKSLAAVATDVRDRARLVSRMLQ